MQLNTIAGRTYNDLSQYHVVGILSVFQCFVYIIIVSLRVNLNIISVSVNLHINPVSVNLYIISVSINLYIISVGINHYIISVSINHYIISESVNRYIISVSIRVSLYINSVSIIDQGEVSIAYSLQFPLSCMSRANLKEF